MLGGGAHAPGAPLFPPPTGMHYTLLKKSIVTLLLQPLPIVTTIILIIQYYVTMLQPDQLYNVMQNIHSATNLDFEAAQRAEREAFIQVLKLLK